jgi:hypothetical protein
VSTEFEGMQTSGREVLRGQLNPYLLKLFEFTRLYQEKNLHDKLLDSIDSYLRFLLKFAIRD